MLMGVGMGATIIAIVLSPWGKQSGAHFNPAVTFTFCRLGKVAWWDAVFYCAAQFLGATAGVALASLVLEGAPAHKAVRYAATLPGIHGEAFYVNTIAFIAELAISFVLMTAILFASNHAVLAPYTHYFAALLVALYIAFESPLSGMSTNPPRTFGPAVYANYWHTLWIYFVAPSLGMLAAAQAFLLARARKAPYCAKLHHHNDKRCIFRHSEAHPTARTR
jgi:aquaporin Z